MLLALALLAVLPYLNALRAGFTYDDGLLIRRNPLVTGGIDPVGIFASMFGVQYRPLTPLTFAFNEALTPGNAAAFHAVNLVLHAGVTLLVFLVAKQLFRGTQIAATSAVLFALHPIHTEAVTSLVGRAELLAAVFGLMALASAARRERAVTRRARLALLLISVASFSAALLSKESALTLLPLIPAFRVACRREPLGRGLWNELLSLDWLPYAACTVVFLVLRWHVLSATATPLILTPLYNPLAFVSWTARMRSALGVLWDYFGLLNVPFVLAADYSYNQVPVVTSWIAPRFLAGLGLVVAAAWIVVRHPRPAVRFAALFPFVALSVTANVLFPIGTIKAERLLYLPSVGWALLAAYFFDRLFRNPRYRTAAASALCGLLALFAARTWARNGDWQNDATLYLSMVRSAPYSAKAQYSLGVALLEARHYDTAVRQFRRAFDIYADANTALALGVTFDKKGAIDEAVSWYGAALAITPQFPEAHTHLCAADVNSGRFEAAIAACRRGLRYHPADPALLKGLGVGLVGTGAVGKGTDVLRRALALNVGDDELRAYLSSLPAEAAAVGTLAVRAAVAVGQ